MAPVFFLQSLEWERFQRLLGRKTRRIKGALVIRHDLPFGFNYLYCPRPELANREQATENRFFEEAEKIAEQEKSVFLKIDPASSEFGVRSSEQEEVNSQLPTPNSQLSHSIQPSKTIILDLTQSEDHLLASMHPKTRYNIRLAERRGVRISNGKWKMENGKFDDFYFLLRETSKRDGFHLHDRAYYENMLAVCSDEFSNELFCAEYRGQALAVALVNFYTPSHAATYVHGASSVAHRDLMAPHLLHWRIIQEAKKRGFRYYDFWGIDERKWPGLTRFKKGFGGRAVEYPESVDIIYRLAPYAFYRISRRIFHG